MGLRNFKIKLLISFNLLFLNLVPSQLLPEQKIVVITASYNNARQIYIPHMGNLRTCEWNLRTIFDQQYSNYEIIYINDASDDGTGQFVENYVQARGMQSKIKIQHNSKRLGALANQYEAIISCHDDDIILIVDGDDGIASPLVFNYLNRVYSDPNVWLTYGQFYELKTGNRGFCSPMPDAVVKCNSFRTWASIPSHLRTCRAGLFKKIKKEDLMLDGQFLQMTGDMATWIPMIEMASKGHFKYIPHILYVYNDTNPLSDHIKDVELQRRIDKHVRSLPPYQPLDSLK